MNDQEFLLHEKYDGHCTPEYESDLLRLKSGVPVAYLIGWVPFLDTKIFLDSHPLIPRAETEYWVEKAVETLKEKYMTSRTGGQKVNLNCLDLFAGSGAVGIVVLKHVPRARVDFGEIENAHISTIKKNIAENHIASLRAKIIKTDVWENIEDSYDYIFANPPYLSRNRLQRIEESVLDHEPDNALFADEDGFSLIRKTIEGLSAHLKDGGALYIEHEPEHEQLLRELALSHGFNAIAKEDQYGVIRYSVLVRG